MLKIQSAIYSADFMQNIQGQSCDILTVNEIPTVLSAFQLISSQWFMDETSITAINLKIKEIIGNPTIYNFGKNRVALITYQSVASENNNSVIFWKTFGCEKFYSIKIANDPNGAVTEFIQEFLVKEIKEGRLGLY